MNKEIKKIVIFRLSSIGDIVLTSALVRCVRKAYPEAQIDFVVKQQFSQLVEFNPHLSNIYTIDSSKGFSGLKSLTKYLKSQNYDVFLDIHKNIRSAYVRNLSKPTKVFVFNKHVFKRSLLTKWNIDLYKNINPVYRRFIDSAKSIGVANDGKLTELFIPESTENKVLGILKEHNIKSCEYILLCPGASFANKRWPADQFAHLALKLIVEGHNVVLSGGNSEKGSCEKIMAYSQNKVLDLAGKLSIIESAVLAKHAKVVVVNDTGMLHISEALGTPVVGIYGPTARQLGYYPILPKSRIAEVELPCRPCTKMGAAECPKKHWKCMKNITVDQVMNELIQIL